MTQAGSRPPETMAASPASDSVAPDLEVRDPLNPREAVRHVRQEQSTSSNADRTCHGGAGTIGGTPPIDWPPSCHSAIAESAGLRALTPAAPSYISSRRRRRHLGLEWLGYSPSTSRGAAATTLWRARSRSIATGTASSAADDPAGPAPGRLCTAVRAPPVSAAAAWVLASSFLAGNPDSMID